MIQTGHSNCAATDDERKVWANLIYYMKQRTRNQVRFDHSSVDDDEPRQPECSCRTYENMSYDIECKSEDRNTVYAYRVEGYTRSELVAESGEVRVNIGSNISHYRYVFDESPTIEKEDLIGKANTSTLGIPAAVQISINSKATPFIWVSMNYIVIESRLRKETDPVKFTIFQRICCAN